MCGTCGCDEPGRAVRAPGARSSPTHVIEVERRLLARNDAAAAQLRARLQADRILALNLVSSPGAGKTTLLVETLARLEGSLPLAVIEGDQQTSLDADRIRATGAPAWQVNTGRGCHLEADQVRAGLDQLPWPAGGLLLIENVGNLVCPAMFDLGEAAKVVLLSVTEGDDKPLKYPHIFAAASLVVITKIDLLPYVSFDMSRCLEGAREVNPGLQHLALSATTGEGMEGWLGWIRAAARQTSGQAPGPQAGRVDPS